MKPTVISSGGNENPSSQHPSGSSVNPARNMAPNGEGGSGAVNSNPNVRQFPQFQTGFGFDPDDDLFSDPRLRSRLNRFRDPFSFARKRCGNSENADDPYARYFDDDPDFFPNFGSFPGRRRAPTQNPDTAPFFDHIPSEFRHYIPDGFGFPNVRTTSAHPQAHPQQYYESYVQPSSPTAQPPQQKPKLCDVAIQTEDLSEPDGVKEGKNLKQYGMRNTVDLGQKSPPEECRSPRSHSAPPPDNGDQNVPQRQTVTETPSNTQNQSEDFQHRSQGTQPMTPPHPPPRHPQHPQYQPWHQHQKQQQHQQQPQYQDQPQYQQQSQHPQAASPGFIRTVPIFVEGRSEPTVNKTVIPPQQSHPQQETRQKPGHPTPINTQQQIPPNSQMPPQTPHTAECIRKIQGIQRDVLDLMGKVEHFQGVRGDKEYMYLDEMLTRNLLKLDTIDTNGKDSIRLARREAIKCIQASINVLEAKAEENVRTAEPQQAVIGESGEENKVNEPTKAEQDAPQNPPKSPEDEATSLPPENIPIPLPPPPMKESEPEPSDQSKEGSVKDPKLEDVKKEGQPVPEPTPATLTTKEQEKPSEQEQTTITEGEESKSAVEKGAELKLQASPKVETQTQKKSESGNEGESAKPSNTGTVKKKIIKKKKVPAASASPSDNSTAENTPPPEVAKPEEKIEQKSEENPSPP